MNLRRFAALCLATAAFSGIGANVAVADPVPGSGVTAEDLGNLPVPFAGLGNDSTSTLVAKKVTIAPGGTTGFHTHPGPVFAFVSEGTLTRVLADCKAEVTGPGGLIREAVGETHTGKNLGTAPVVLYVLYVQPTGTALAAPVETPTCASE